MIARDPRRMRCAIFSMLTLGAATLALVREGLTWIESVAPDDAPVVLVIAFILVFLLIVAVALFMIATGVVLIRKEGGGLSHSLSLLAGLGMLAYFGVSLWAAFAGAFDVIVPLFLLAFPLFWFSFALAAYLLYSAAYGFIATRWVKPGQSVVVLGSGIIGDRVPPLLARRVDLGVKTFGRSIAMWGNAALVMSGGKGADEKIAEGTAMLRYAQDQGLDVEAMEAEGSDVIAETRSVSTYQNLEFSRALLQEKGRQGKWTVVTSDFHAFRAANLMSRMGIPGNAIGARTTVYFWMSAKLREFIAILAHAKKTTVFFAVASFIPAGIYVLSMLGNPMG